MAEFFDEYKRGSHEGFETATYHFGYGKFVKNKSTIAQHIIENFIEMKDLTDIYIETNAHHGIELINMINNNNSPIQFNFDCNMVLENTDGVVVTGDLKSLELSKNQRLICVTTADSVLCFELK